jgi:hypothetical protein
VPVPAALRNSSPWFRLYWDQSLHRIQKRSGHAALKFLLPVEFLRIFIVYGARILRELGKIAPLLKTSEEAARRTVDSEKRRRAIHSAGALMPSSSTRSRTAGERDFCTPGQAVFVADSNPDSDMTWPALVVRPAGCDSDGKQFFVKLVGDSDRYPPFEIPKSRLILDAFGDDFNRGDDDDDVVRANFAANDMLVADRGVNPPNFLAGHPSIASFWGGEDFPQRIYGPVAFCIGNTNCQLWSRLTF